MNGVVWKRETLLMPDYQELTDAQWDRVKDHLPFGSKGKPGRNANNRRFFNALLWMARSGGRWRDLPERYGAWQNVKRRYYLWVEAGVLEALFERLSADPDTEWVMLDATIVKAHAQAGGARHKKGDLMPTALVAPRAA
jgi:transposase